MLEAGASSDYLWHRPENPKSALQTGQFADPTILALYGEVDLDALSE